MKIVAIDNADLSLVVLDKSLDLPENISFTPHCKIHGAMNKVSSFDGGGFWRCIGSVTEKLDNACRAGCMQEPKSKTE